MTAKYGESLYFQFLIFLKNYVTNVNTVKIKMFYVPLNLFEAYNISPTFLFKTIETPFRKHDIRI